MKSIKLLALALILWTITSLDLMAQITMDRSLFSNLGGSTTTSEFQIDYSLGEFKVGSYVMGTLQVHEGFHQGRVKDVSTATKQMSFDDLGVAVFPNPVADHLNITSANADLKSVEIRDNLGRRVLVMDLQGSGELSLGHLPQGSYHVKIQTGAHPMGAVSKIVKR